MELQERLMLIGEAEIKIAEAIDSIKEAVRGTGEQVPAEAYIIPSLNTWIGNGNQYDQHTGVIREAIIREFKAEDADPEQKHWDNLATHNERFED